MTVEFRHNREFVAHQLQQEEEAQTLRNLESMKRDEVLSNGSSGLKVKFPRIKKIKFFGGKRMPSENPPVDPRIVEQIASSPSMAAEQGQGFMESWGGPGIYAQVARIDRPERIVYYAIMDGNVEPSTIGAVTGLTETEVSKAIKFLERKGLVQYEQTEKV